MRNCGQVSELFDETTYRTQSAHGNKARMCVCAVVCTHRRCVRARGWRTGCGRGSGHTVRCAHTRECPSPSTFDTQIAFRFDAGMLRRVLAGLANSAPDGARRAPGCRVLCILCRAVGTSESGRLTPKARAYRPTFRGAAVSS